MSSFSLRFVASAFVLAFLSLGVLGCTELSSPSTDTSTPEGKIKNAMSAAPMSIAKDATIMDWPAAEGAQPKQLRAGTNGWVCLPNDPATPGDDPVCMDSVFQKMIDAYMQKKPFSTDTAGVSYMLQGGAAASNTDPYKTSPDAGEKWIMDPPHVMWISPNPADLDKLATDPHSGGPYVMWKGTPYAHVMIPVNMSK
jgi:hypothetical protein